MLKFERFCLIVSDGLVQLYPQRPLEKEDVSEFQSFLGDFIQDFDEGILQKETCVVNIVLYGLDGEEDLINPCFIQQIAPVDKAERVGFWNPIPQIHFVKLELDISNDFVRSYLFMDGSIWNYGFWCVDNCETLEALQHYKSYSTEQLTTCLKTIYANWVNKYYEVGNAREYADLNARIAREAKINGGPHFEVSPFVFHSERHTFETLTKILTEGRQGYSLGYKWRMLLLDDHSSSPLNGRNEEAPVSLDLTKTSIIIDRLRSINFNGETVKVKYKRANEDCWKGDDDCDIAIECAETVDDFFLCVFGNGNTKAPKRYDIILLDYRLENDYSYRIFSILKSLIALRNKLKEGKNAGDCIKEINHDDINYLAEHNSIKINKDLVIPCDRFVEWVNGGIGPAERLYFMFISSYTYAIQERLEEQGISRSEKYWHIGRGACPINTPSLFLYHLHSIMRKRADTLLGDLKPAHRFFKENMFVVNGDTGLLDIGRCRLAFPDMLKLKSAYEIVLKDCLDEDNGMDGFTSPLCRSVFGDVSSLTPEFWESMRHLSYMISYYSSEHWPEMWTEFLAVKHALDEKNLLNEDWNPMLERIRKHILSLADKF